jgi:aspartyl-tRNA(Asn)/glutamyl-tRNA(Gln) amidotransferase subunit C
MNSDQIIHLANLARLAVPEEELEGLTKDIDSILGFIDTVQSVEVSIPGEVVHDKVNVFREDLVMPLESAYDLVKAAPVHNDGFVSVPKVIE